MTLGSVGHTAAQPRCARPWLRAIGRARDDGAGGSKPNPLLHPAATLHRLRRGIAEDMTPRRFPPPWTVDEANDACFIVHDANGQALGYFYFEDEPGRRSVQSHQAEGPA